MPVSLHVATVGHFLQVLPSLAGLVDKAEAHCTEHGVAPETLLGAALADDMWPFAKQVMVAVAHSAGAVEGVRAGKFGPDLSAPPTDFAGLRTAVAGALATVQAVPDGEIDAMAGNDMYFAFGERRMDFTVADFLLSFSLPNFYFHTSAAYAILRNQVLTVGKMDFMGRPRLKG
jgi:uncharacterized protein